MIKSQQAFIHSYSQHKGRKKHFRILFLSTCTNLHKEITDKETVIEYSSFNIKYFSKIF